MSLDRLEAFQRVFQLPQEMLPYIDLVASEREIDLVVGMGERSMTQAQIAEMMGLGGAEAEQFLLRAKQRAIVDRQADQGVPLYRASSFYRRLTYLSMQQYDQWCAVPLAERETLLAWHLEENIRHHGLVHKLNLLRENPHAVEIHNRDILLLDQALELVDAAELHVVVPCDCRTTVIACEHSRWNTCLRLDERGSRTLEQGEGQIVSKQVCREIVLNAHQEGLIQTGQRAEHGRKAVLNGNCCPCCSYPIRAGIALGTAKQWPKSHYLASVSWDACDHCGVCVERCPFEAFYQNGTIGSLPGEKMRQVTFDPEKCWGCGLCVSTCPVGAIVMEPLRQ
jgi:NAD-dependent dihydropyrimidine dehydrogenase PreA subunit